MAIKIMGIKSLASVVKSNREGMIYICNRK